MITHSLIVCALFSFSLAVQANGVSTDGNVIGTSTEAIAAINAIFHKDVGLQQRGGVDKDVAVPSPSLDDCMSRGECVEAAIEQHGVRVETLKDLLILNKEPSGSSFLIFIIFVILLGMIYATRSSPSAK